MEVLVPQNSATDDTPILTSKQKETDLKKLKAEVYNMVCWDRKYNKKSEMFRSCVTSFRSDLFHSSKLLSNNSSPNTPDGEEDGITRSLFDDDDDDGETEEDRMFREEIERDEQLNTSFISV